MVFKLKSYLFLGALLVVSGAIGASSGDKEEGFAPEYWSKVFSSKNDKAVIVDLPTVNINSINMPRDVEVRVVPKGVAKLRCGKPHSIRLTVSDNGELTGHMAAARPKRSDFIDRCTFIIPSSETNLSFTGKTRAIVEEMNPVRRHPRHGPATKVTLLAEDNAFVDICSINADRVNASLEGKATMRLLGGKVKHQHVKLRGGSSYASTGLDEMPDSTMWVDIQNVDEAARAASVSGSAKTLKNAIITGYGSMFYEHPFEHIERLVIEDGKGFFGPSKIVDYDPDYSLPKKLQGPAEFYESGT